MSEPESPILMLRDHPDAEVTFMFEDDGRTGYAYLFDESRTIVADVWVYNRAETPETPDWTSLEKAPFLNCRAYCAPRTFVLPESEGDIDLEWRTDRTGRLGAALLVRGLPVAELYMGDKPGYALMAIADGPLANRMKQAP